MPKQELRYAEYLSSYHFYPNSIEFRIVSSKAIEKFKNIQSFQLNQLVNGGFYFQQDRREILLLKYDMWSRWLTEVENLFIELHEHSDIVRQKDIDIVLALAKKTSEKYESIILQDHPGHFHDEFANVWIEVHSAAFKYIIEEIRAMNGTYEKVFTKITDLICEALQYTLTEIHELNEMFKNPEADEIFLVATPFCSKYYKSTQSCLIANRAKIYKSHFAFTKVWFKNYTDDKLPDGLIQSIEDIGLEVDYRRCIFK
jgi:hypothetical protein